MSFNQLSFRQLKQLADKKLTSELRNDEVSVCSQNNNNMDTKTTEGEKE